MSSTNQQDLANHTRWVPFYHFVTGALTIVVLAWTLYRLVSLRTADALLGALIGIALTSNFWYLRAFPLAVQDRLIRLEERLRLEKLTPADQRSGLDQLTANQLIALRFASDAELPALAKKVLAERVTDRKSVKAMIVNWRADHMRA